MSALARWHQELRDGTRTVYALDDLKLAAGEEVKARDFERSVACTGCRQARGRWYRDRWLCAMCAEPVVAIAPSPGIRSATKVRAAPGFTLLRRMARGAA